jgi:hypothetical protein
VDKDKEIIEKNLSRNLVAAAAAAVAMQQQQHE